MLLRVAFDRPDHTLGLPLGHKVVLRAKLDGEEVTEVCTPITHMHQQGHVDFLVSPEGLGRLKAGDSVELRGKVSGLIYHGLGYFEHSKSKDLGKRNQVGYVLTGKDTALVYRLILTSLMNEDEVKHWLVYEPGASATLTD